MTAAIVAGGGVRSGSGFAVSQALVNDSMRILPKGVGQHALAGLASTSRLADSMDTFFRLNVAYDALLNGRSLEDATDLARRSLYDYGDMTAFEKWLSANVFIFYSFTRQLTVQTMKNFFSVQGFKRMTNLLKLQRGAEQITQQVFGYDKESTVWLPKYTLSRPFLSLRETLEKDVYNVGPSVPQTEGIILIVSLLSGGLTDEIREQLSPNVQAALGIEGFRTSTRQLSPEHVVLLQSVNAMPMMETILGGTLEAVPALPEDGAVGGFIYPLTDQQESRYKWIMGAGQFIGSSTVVRDYIRIFGGHKEFPFQDMSWQERWFLFGSGAVTPVKAERPTTQALRQSQQRQQEVGGRMKESTEEEQSIERRGRD